MSISEDMTSGLCCQWCGIYFEKEHGYPVLCKDCYNDDIEASRDLELKKATHEEI
jgi:hypothetical protein